MRFALLFVAGCGRFDFAELHDASRDAIPPFSCPGNAASTVTINGRTFHYTNFMNQVATLDTVAVELVRADETVAATTTSDASGNYTLASETGALHFRFARASYQTTLIYSDMPLDRDLAATAQPVFALGDGPLWQSTALDSVYTVAGAARNTTKGTLNIGARDCDGNPLEGVRFTVEPPPGLATYQDSGGMPDASLSATVGPFAHFIGLNAEPGHNHITASKEGLRFGELDVDIVAQTSMLGVVHGGY